MFSYNCRPLLVFQHLSCVSYGFFMHDLFFYISFTASVYHWYLSLSHWRGLRHLRVPQLGHTARGLWPHSALLLDAGCHLVDLLGTYFIWCVKCLSAERGFTAHLIWTTTEEFSIFAFSFWYWPSKYISSSTYCRSLLLTAWEIGVCRVCVWILCRVGQSFICIIHLHNSTKYMNIHENASAV